MADQGSTENFHPSPPGLRPYQRKDGKIKYVPIVSFASKEARDKFSAAVIEAIRRQRAEALNG